MENFEHFQLWFPRVLPSDRKGNPSLKIFAFHGAGEVAIASGSRERQSHKYRFFLAQWQRSVDTKKSSLFSDDYSDAFSYHIVEEMKFSFFAGMEQGIWTSGIFGKQQHKMNPFITKENIHVFCCQLPKRGMRMNRSEEALPHIEWMAQKILEQIVPLVCDKSAPYILLGHSMGAFCAYELACQIREKNFPLPKRMILLSIVSPLWPIEQRPWNHRPSLTDSELKDEMRKWGANQVLFEEETWKVYKDLMSFDRIMLSNYKPDMSDAKYRPLGLDCSLMVGESDTRINEENLSGWKIVISGDPSSEYTSCYVEKNLRPIKRVSFEKLSGNHSSFFFQPEDRNMFVESLLDEIENILLDIEYD